MTENPMSLYQPYLQWIEHHEAKMIALLESLANQNSHSHNPIGLHACLQQLKEQFLQIGGEIQELTLPPHSSINDKGEKVTETLSKALLITKNAKNKEAVRVFLCGHMDTVYMSSSSFQKVAHKDKETLHGPGVADMKGGLIILLSALQALEKSPFASQISWEVLITPDEEIGSPGSRSILERAAKRNHLGLIFEPAFADGALVSSRGGSINLTIVTKGRAAHAGRDFTAGKSALLAALRLIQELEAFNSDELIVNVGEIISGTGFNIVPELAITKVNLRGDNKELMIAAKEKIRALVEKYNTLPGISVKLFEISSRLPKPLDQKTEALFSCIEKAALDLGMKLEKRPTKGVSDGNILASFGLPTIDSLGAVGGRIHSTEEYMHIPSLVERSKLTALFLMKLANGEFDFFNHSKPSTIEL